MKSNKADTSRRGERYGNMGTIVGTTPNGTLWVAYDNVRVTYEEQCKNFDERLRVKK